MVKETESLIDGSDFNSIRDNVVLPAPDGEERINSSPRRFSAFNCIGLLVEVWLVLPIALALPQSALKNQVRFVVRLASRPALRLVFQLSQFFGFAAFIERFED